MDNAALKGGMLIRVKLMMSQLTTHHPTQYVDKVSLVQIGKPILIWVMGTGLTEEVMSGGVLHSILVTSILGEKDQNTCNNDQRRLTRYPSSLNIKGVMAQP